MKKNAQPLVSVIIPTLNHSELLEKCISSFVDTVFHISYELIVVDDGSTQAEKEKIGALASRFDCRLIELPSRQSYAKAVNTGIKSSTGKFVLLLNNDVVFQQKGWLKQLIKTAESAGNIGIVGCRLLYPDGTIQHAGGVLFEDERYDHLYRGEPGNEPKACLIYDVPAVTGALMLIKREVFLDIALLSEDYLLSFEDVDFCLRARERGWRVVYCGKAVAIHDEGSTRGKSKEEKPDDWYVQEILSYTTFWSRWRNFASIQPLQGISLIFLLSNQCYVPPDQKLSRITAGLSEHGCQVLVKKMDDLHTYGQMGSLSVYRKNPGRAVLITNDPAFFQAAGKDSWITIPSILIGKHHWYRNPFPQDIHQWINLASKHIHKKT